MEYTKVGTEALATLMIGAALSVLLPLAIALIWKFKKKEPFTTILIGAATFMAFAIMLEKPIQNILLFPTQMMLPDHAIAQFVNARPILLSLLVALFPGVFEETGRLVMYKTVLKNRKNRETAISHGIGHGGFEVIFIMGSTYATYIAYALMINSGTFDTVIAQVKEQAPEQLDAMYLLAEQIAAIRFTDLGLGFLERAFAVLFHIGGSLLVFYACRDKGKFWLYPLAIVLHTAMDFVAALSYFQLISISTIGLEAIIAVTGILTFCCAYFLLYRKDKGDQSGEV